jgi:pyridoxamine 5'-phosphate oxidase
MPRRRARHRKRNAFMKFFRQCRKGLSAWRGLHESDLASDPFTQFTAWYNDAQKLGLAYPNAMALSTATADGKPSVRMVLLKDYDTRGFTFFTNYESRKGQEIKENAYVALLFYWEPLERQVRIEGRIEKTSEEESFAYFKSRPRGSRIGAWASAQSRPIASREALEARVKEFDSQYPGDDIPLPPYWGGFRCAPDSIEFWQGRINRLHDRLCYQRSPQGWHIQRLSP